MTTREICEYYGQIYENVKHMTEYIKGLKKQYSIEVEGDYVEDEYYGETEVWIDKNGKGWIVPITIVRDFKNAYPEEN